MSAPKECPVVCPACWAPRKEDAGNYYECHSWIRLSGNLNQSPECEAREADDFRRKLHDAIGDPDWKLTDAQIVERVAKLRLFAGQYRDFARAAVGDADNILGRRE